MTDFGQAQIRIILTQQQPVFSATGEHPVGFRHPPRHQIIDQDAEIGFIPTGKPGRFTFDEQSGVDSGQQSLRCRFLVAGRAIDLAGEEQTPDRPGLQGIVQITRIEIVVFNRVAGPGDMRLFQTPHGPYQRQLDIERQTGGNAIRIELMGLQAFRLQENLVGMLVGKAVNFVFDGWAVARTDAFNHAGIQRRPI